MLMQLMMGEYCKNNTSNKNIIRVKNAACTDSLRQVDLLFSNTRDNATCLAWLLQYPAADTTKDANFCHV